MSKTIAVGWLVDGSGGPIQKNVLLRVKNSRIIAIEARYESLGKEEDWLDLSHCTVLPPFVDCHVHLFMSGSIDPVIRKKQLVAEYDELRPVISSHLHYLFSHGVLAVRDGGDRGGAALRFLSEEDLNPQMTVQASGLGYHRKNRYGQLIGPAIGDDVDLTEAWLRDGLATPWVKLVNSGLNSLVEFGKETRPQFSVDEIRKLVQAASRRGAKVMVHVNGREAVRGAVEAGCHSIEHGYFMGRENLELMAERGVVWVPTIAVMKGFLDNMHAVSIPAKRKVIEKTFDDQLAQLAFAREIGVNVALGTDSGGLGVLHGESLVEEMKLYGRAGYNFAETVACATTAGAELMGFADWHLKEGGRASFLVARGGPSQLPRKLSYLEDIYVDGEPSPYYRKNPIKSVAGHAGNQGRSPASNLF